MYVYIYLCDMYCFPSNMLPICDKDYYFNTFPCIGFFNNLKEI